MEKSGLHILEHCLIDNMKSLYNNGAILALTGNLDKTLQGALATPSASVDIYVGFTVARSKGKDVWRTAYATGSGAASIGLDPRRAMIHNVTPDIEELIKTIKPKVMEHFQQQGLGNMNCNFNHVSVKIYYKKKETNFHCDIQFTDGHVTPSTNNSQVPGTPVVMCNIGSEKRIEFLRFSQLDTENPVKVKGRTKSQTLRQKHGSITILDPRDEFLSRGYFWKHRAYLVDASNDVAMTMMLRVVHSFVRVNKYNSRLSFPMECMPGGLNGEKIKQFNKAWKKITNTDLGTFSYNKLSGTIHCSQLSLDYVLRVKNIQAKIRYGVWKHFRYHQKPWRTTLIQQQQNKKLTGQFADQKTTK